MVADYCKHRSELRFFHQMRPVCRLGDYELRKDDCAPKFVFSAEDKEGKPTEALLRGDH